MSEGPVQGEFLCMYDLTDDVIIHTSDVLPIPFYVQNLVVTTFYGYLAKLTRHNHRQESAKRSHTLTLTSAQTDAQTDAQE